MTLRIATQSVFDVAVSVNQVKSYSFSVDITTSQEWDYTASDLRLQVVLIESHIPENWFSLHEVNFVCREMYPNQNGTEVTLANNGDSENYHFDIDVPDTYDVMNCELVVFLQDNGTKEVMNSEKVSLGQIVGLAEMGETASRIYPNPATDQFTVESEYRIKHLSVVSLTGQTVYELALDQQTVNVTTVSLLPGLYLVEVETESGKSLQKLTIQ